ncbi:MAG: choice-of-anchor B family protein, partial [Phaeodactylibacter sp.]|nr:choice-of-anchor B family protein [Phaeodactylibacter sp.]
LDVFAHYNRGDERYSGSWVYVGPDGSEYALIGAKTGTAVYAIDDPAAVEELGFIPGPASNWREITVVGAYAYVTTEATGPGQGMQIIDLTQLPSAVSLAATYTATFTRGHIIQKDIFEESPYVYVVGTDSTGGVHILDVSNPDAPEEIGLYNPGYYIHDCHVRGNRLYACAFYEKTVDIVDITDPTAPQLITTIPDPGSSTHSVSTTLTEDYLFIADEQDGQPGRIFNIEDIENIEPVSSYTANVESLVHNPYIKGDLVTISHNTEGLRLLDIKDPSLPVEIAYYDTYDGPSGGFSGLWSACPYLPSGKIIGGDRTEGLFVSEHTGPKAGRIYGQVVDSLTGMPLSAAQVILSTPDDTLALDNLAAFKFGRLPGNYTLSVTLPGYESKVINIDLQSEVQENLLVELAAPISALSPEPGNESQLIILENPVQAQLNIRLPATIPPGGQLRIVAEQGQLIHGQKILEDHWNLDIGSWPVGLYL